MGILSLDTEDRAASLLRRQVAEMTRLHGVFITFRRGSVNYATSILLSSRPQNFVEGLSWTVIETISSEAIYGILAIDDDSYIPKNGDLGDLTYRGEPRTFEIYRIGSEQYPAFVYYKLIMNPYFEDTNVPDLNPTDDHLQIDPNSPQKDSPVYDNDIYDY